MILLCNLLMGISLGLFLYAIWVYQKNAEYEFRDEMGLAINFNHGYGLTMIVLTIALVLHPNIKWWWGLVAFTSILYAPFILRPLIHNLLKLFKLVDRPNKTNP